MNVHDLLILVAAVLAGLAAFNVNSPIHLGWAGFCLFLVSLIV